MQDQVNATPGYRFPAARPMVGVTPAKDIKQT
jgi:hypothetical protein